MVTPGPLTKDTNTGIDHAQALPINVFLQGTSLIVFGPTLLDIASHLSVGVGVLAVMFTCRAIGSGIGSVSTGVIFDKFPSWSYTTLSVITSSCIASTL